MLLCKVISAASARDRSKNCVIAILSFFKLIKREARFVHVVSALPERQRVGESGTMKLFVAFLIATLAAIASATCASSSYGAAAGAGAAAYGAGAVSSPPCPNNYLFSCSPKLVPVPCSAPSSAYGSAGAYSEPLPSYAYFADNFPAQYYQ